MNKDIKKQIKAMEKMRLPELQARFAEIVGEETRAPNRKFLLRRISEALEAQAAKETPAKTKANPKPAKKKRRAPKTAEARSEATTEAEDPGERLTDLSVEELQTRYLEKVGRPTGSTNASYLKWKIRQAEKGRITVGPIQRRHGDGPPPDCKVLPLRMETDLVVQLDEARERLGLKSRMELFRLSLQSYLEREGETEVAALFNAEA